VDSKYFLDALTKDLLNLIYLRLSSNLEVDGI
jgi:hypothetical protein